MGKKSRRKNRKDWVFASPDEIISAGPLRIERYGRFIRFSNKSTSEEHAAFLTRSEEVNKKLISQLEAEVPALQSLIKKYDSVELLHRAAYMLLPLFMKYRSENEFGYDESYYLPTVEYLQYLVARTPATPDSGGKAPPEDDWAAIWDQAIKVLRLTQSYLLTRKTITTPPSEIDELRFHLDGKRLAIRGRRYHYFFEDFLRTALGPYEQLTKEIYGVGIEEILDGLKRIGSYLMTGVLGRYRNVIDIQKRLQERLVLEGYQIIPSASGTEVERTKRAIASDAFKALRDELEEASRLTFTPAIFDITDITNLPKALLSLLSIRPGESVLTTLTGPGHDDLSPLSTSVLHSKPFVEANGRFYSFYHSGFEDHIDDIIESDLFEKRPNQIPVMCKRRSDRLEEETGTLLRSILKPDVAFQNLYYPDADNSGALTELDSLIAVDDLLFLVEAKAGGFTEDATRGAPKAVEKKLSDLIIEGQRQSERAEKYVKSAAEVAFFDQTGKNVIHRVKHSQFRRIFRIIVTREELGWVGAQIAILSILDPNLSKSYPWHVSIDDLRIVAELFKESELRFVHYLEQRLIASAETTLSQSDEIEHIGLYNKINHYHELPVKGMDRMKFDASYMRDIDYYFAEKMSGGTPKLPAQELPVNMQEFLDGVRSSRLPGRFEVGSIVYSMDEATRIEFSEGLKTLDAGKAEGRERTLRLPFGKVSYGLSVTYAGEENFQKELIISAAQMELCKCERWLIVQLGDARPYAVTRIETVLPGRFSEAELAPGRLHNEERAQRTIRAAEPGRNNKCPCGSGKKFKKCHGR